MTISEKFKGTVLTVLFSILTIPAAFVPVIPLSADSFAEGIRSLANLFTNNCEGRTLVTFLIYFILSLIVSYFFYRSLFRKNFTVLLLVPFLCYQFFILQYPLFVFELGMDFYCHGTDGQAIFAYMDSSIIVSFLLVPFGLFFDFVRSLNRIKQN